ncbi:MAG: crotonobetainyl-CoA:carnitine CoA-transferase CaiB-like acyl-CoA transferase [Hyphomicrobiaceae bacterium]|jgi:crotonobetainyl-CoA:carnitine CoA-transferase CaiB-like acyl-CoA transferase
MLPARRMKFGIDADTLLARNPGLVYAALSGYGGKGPELENDPRFTGPVWGQNSAEP